MKNVDKIKKAIIDGYRRGVCDSDGGYIPEYKMGRNGKGSHFISTKASEIYKINYERIFGHS
jgi:hypothetical protein